MESGENTVRWAHVGERIAYCEPLEGSRKAKLWNVDEKSGTIQDLKCEGDLVFTYGTKNEDRRIAHGKPIIINYVEGEGRARKAMQYTTNPVTDIFSNDQGSFRSFYIKTASGSMYLIEISRNQDPEPDFEGAKQKSGLNVLIDRFRKLLG